MQNLTIIGNIPANQILNVFNKILSLKVKSINKVSTLDKNSSLIELVESISTQTNESEKHINIFLDKENSWRCSVHKFCLKRDFCDYDTFLENY